MRLKSWFMLTLWGLCIQTTHAAQGTSVAELLQQSQAQAAQIRLQNQQREQQFTQQFAQQKQLLEKAKQQLTQLQQQNKVLKQQFEQNEAHISQTQQAVKEQLGELDNLFSYAKQGALDIKTLLQDSVLNLQYEQTQLTPFLSEQSLFNSAELTGLFNVYQTQIQHNGQIDNFTHTVTAADGQQSSASITRLGTFMLFDPQSLIIYQPKTAQLQRIEDIPSESFIHTWFQSPENQLTEVILDPSKGRLLEMQALAPNLMQRIAQGGWVGYIIIVIGISGILFALGKWLYLIKVARHVGLQLKYFNNPKPNNPLGRVLLSYRQHEFTDLDTVELQLNEAVLNEMPSLEKGHSMVKLLSAATPLLGLLGTVTGMILTFQSITQFGTSDPKLMAGGISQALMTTVLGIVAALPLIFLHNRLVEHSRAILHVLQQQSAGLLAKHFLAQHAKAQGNA